MMMLFGYMSVAQPTEALSSGDDKRFFGKIFGSYSITTPGSFKAPSSQTTIRSETGSTSSFKDQKKGLGSGLRAGIGLGVILNEYINIGVDAEYLSGTKLKSNSSQQIYGTVIYTNTNGSTSQLPDTTLSKGDYVMQHNLLSIIPHVTFKAISTNQYYIYTRVGVIIGIPLQVKITETNNSLHTTKIPTSVNPAFPFSYFTETSVKSNHEYKSNPGIGYQAALGIQMRISDNLRFYAEVVSNSLILHPLEYEETDNTTITVNKRSTNGQPATSAPIVTDHSRTIQQFTNNSTTGTRASGPPLNQVVYFQSSKISIPINSLNIGVGLAFRF